MLGAEGFVFMARVLVTGGTGFIAGHTLLQLLAAGHEVRTTVRSLGREAGVRAMLKAHGADTVRLTFVEAELTADGGWAEAVAGCEFVLHMASPFPVKAPRDEMELIVPAREGTVRVLRAAREAGVKRVVVTSSFAAIGYGHAPRVEAFDERDWTDLSGTREVPAYPKSKTLAERAAWEFMEREGGGMELAVVNPVAVFGPVLGPEYAASVEVVARMLTGGMPACPRISLGVVDVRDVAALHLLAMTRAEAAGERWLAVAGESVSIYEIGQMLRARLGEAAKKVPTRMIPDWVLKFVGIFDATVRGARTELGQVKHGSSAKAKRVLGWEPRSVEEAVVTCGESLVGLGGKRS